MDIFLPSYIIGCFVLAFILGAAEVETNRSECGPAVVLSILGMILAIAPIMYFVLTPACMNAPWTVFRITGAGVMLLFPFSALLVAGKPFIADVFKVLNKAVKYLGHLG